MADIYQPYIRPYYPRTTAAASDGFARAFKTGQEMGGDIGALVANYLKKQTEED